MNVGSLVRRVLFSLVCAGTIGAGHLTGQNDPGAAGALTLGDAVDLALAAHPLIRAAESRIEVERARVDQARAAKLPEVRISETLTRGNNPVFAFGSLLEQNRFGPENFALSSLNDPASLTNFRSVLSSRVPVYDGRQRTYGIAMARAGETGAVEDRKAAEQRIRFEAIQSYFGVVLSRAARDVAVRATRIAESDVELVRSRLDAGMAVDADLLAVQVQSADFRRQQVEAEGNAATAESEFNILIGRPSAGPVSLMPPPPRTDFTIPSEDDLVTAAIARRPDYAATRSQVESSRLAVRERKGEWLPRVDVFANVGMSGRSPVTGSSDYAVGASVTFNVLDAGRDARIREAMHAESAAAARRLQQEREIHIDVLRARQRVVTAAEQVRVSQAGVAQAREVLRVTEDRYQAGLSTITALLRAQTDLVRAEMNLIAAQDSYTVGYAGLLLATGALEDLSSFSR